MSHTNLSEIKSNIRRWETVRNSLKGFELLRSGFAFVISQSDFLNWQKMKSKPDTLHVYLAVNSLDELTFYIVDNLTDEKGRNDEKAYEFGKNIFCKHFNNIIKPSGSSGIQSIPDMEFSDNSGISESVVLRKIMLWQLFGYQWFENEISKTGVVKAFSVPFSDLESIFSKSTDSTNTEAFLFFGIHQKNDPKTRLKNYIELVLCKHNLDISEKKSVLEIFEDVSKPKPPFSGLDGYNLF